MTYIGSIAIVGAGNVGSTLGRGWDAADHSVVFGVRDPESTRVGDLRVVSIAEAVAGAKTVVLAVPGDAVVDVVRAAADKLAGKVVIDATNTMNAEGTLALWVADAAPDARVVKAFNTVGFEGMADPTFPEADATMFVAGDDPEAKRTARRLARDLGFDPVDAGDLAAATHLEALARLWVHLSRTHGRQIAFRLLTR